MRVPSAILTATLALVPLAAGAQPVSGLYIGAGVGWNWLQDSDANIKGVSAGTLAAAIPGARLGGTIEYEDGWAGVLSLGWGFGNGLRAEVEGNIRENSVDSLSGFGATLGGFGGTARTWA